MTKCVFGYDYGELYCIGAPDALRKAAQNEKSRRYKAKQRKLR